MKMSQGCFYGAIRDTIGNKRSKKQQRSAENKNIERLEYFHRQVRRYFGVKTVV